MYDYNNDDSYQQYREEIDDDRYEREEEEEKYNGHNGHYYDREEDREDATDPSEYSWYYYSRARQTFRNQMAVTVPPPSLLDQVSVSEGKLIMMWILEERFGTVDVLTQIIVSYVDDTRLAELFESLEKLRLT
jgi:hypothetical protein